MPQRAMNGMTASIIHPRPAAGERKTREAEDAEEQAGKQAAAFPKVLHERANQDAGHHGRGDAYHCE